MARHPAVGVHDDLAPGESGVTHRTADLEPAGGVHQQPVVGRVEVEGLEDRLDDVLADVGGQHVLQADVLGVLARHDDGVDALRPVVLVVLDGDLGLAVGPQVRDGAVLAHRGQPLGQPVRQRDRQRHQCSGVVAGVAEHQALVACALAVERVGAPELALLERVVDALGDVRGLLADRHRDAAGLAVEALDRAVVADAEDDVADDARHVGEALGRDLPRDVHLAGGQHGLDGDPAAGVLGQQVVEDGVADLVGHLVRVALGDRLGREQAAGHVAPPRWVW